MLIPEGLVRGQIEEGKVYRFYDTIPEGSDVVPNHFHVCFKLNEEIVYLLCCTTKNKTIDDYIRVNHLDPKTKVHIAPTPENGLTEDTYLNCNNTLSCDFEDLVKAISDGSVTLMSIAPPVCGGIDVFNVTFFYFPEFINNLQCYFLK